MTSSSAEEEAYFAHNPPPTNLSSTITTARDFIAYHASSGVSRRVALVTSGGTTVPLENQTVRFIDNFSAGTRGACSAEYLISAGYAVIFLHRQYSLLPFSRHYSHSTNCFLDFMDFAAGNGENGDDGVTHEGGVVVRREWQSSMRGVLSRYNQAKRENLLVSLPFVTINEYLWALREVARLMKPLGSGALFYLAAAVSDFFVPAERMVEHKIQSGEEFQARGKPDGEDALVDGNGIEVDGGQEQKQHTLPPAAHVQDKSLIIDLDPVPKFLKRLVDGWAPEGMIVSFKLETDPTILAEKARHALRKYAHHLVIGNLLSTRKWEVVFVSAVRGGESGDIHEKWIRVPTRKRQSSASGLEGLVGRAQANGESKTEDAAHGGDDEVGEPIVEIESMIIPEVASLHKEFMTRTKGSGE